MVITPLLLVSSSGDQFVSSPSLHQGEALGPALSTVSTFWAVVTVSLHIGMLHVWSVTAYWMVTACVHLVVDRMPLDMKKLCFFRTAVLSSDNSGRREARLTPRLVAPTYCHYQQPFLGIWPRPFSPYDLLSSLVAPSGSRLVVFSRLSELSVHPIQLQSRWGLLGVDGIKSPRAVLWVSGSL